MRLSHSVKRNLSVAAALAGLGLLSATARRPSRPLRRRPATDGDSLATLRDKLGGVAQRAPASGGAAYGREADTPSEIPARGWCRFEAGAGDAGDISRPGAAVLICIA
jgi:hypothetical protein